MLIEDTKTTQNREINLGTMKGKVLQRERGSLNGEVYKNSDWRGPKSSNIVCEKPEKPVEKPEKSVGNSYLEVDNRDFLSKEI